MEMHLWVTCPLFVQVVERERQNKELTQEMQRLRRELEKAVGELEKSKKLNIKRGKKTVVKGSHYEEDPPTELDALTLRLAQCKYLYEEMKNENHVSICPCVTCL